MSGSFRSILRSFRHDARCLESVACDCKFKLTVEKRSHENAEGKGKKQKKKKIRISYPRNVIIRGADNSSTRPLSITFAPGLALPSKVDTIRFISFARGDKPLSPVTLFVPPRFQPISPKRTNFSSKPKNPVSRARFPSPVKAIRVYANLFHQSTRHGAQYQFPERRGREKRRRSLRSSKQRQLLVPPPCFSIPPLLQFVENVSRRDRPFSRATGFSNDLKNVAPFHQGRGKISKESTTRRLKFVLHPRGLLKETTFLEKKERI